MADLANVRRRPREEPHQRSIQEQTLDALLRIEELMQQALTENAIAQKAGVDVSIETKATQAKPKARR